MKIGIGGGGICGLTFMQYAKKFSLDARLYEKKQKLDEAGSGILLGINAVKILEELGLAEELYRRGEILETIALSDERGRIISRNNLSRIKQMSGLATVGISRSDLHQILSHEIDPNKIFTGREVKGIQKNQTGFEFCFDDEKVSNENFSLIVVADGVHSRIRESLHGKIPLRYSGYTSWRFITHRPANMPSQLLEMLGRGKRIGIVPVSQDKVYVYATLNSDWGAYNRPLEKKEFVKMFSEFDSWAADVLSEFLNDTSAVLIHRDLADMYKVYLSDREYTILLAGDAAHATTPNLGQGAAMGMEDAHLFFSLYKSFAANSTLPNLQEIIKTYAKNRARRTERLRRYAFRLGQMNQLENIFLRKLRNAVMRSISGRYADKSLVKLLMEYEI